MGSTPFEDWLRYHRLEIRVHVRSQIRIARRRIVNALKDRCVPAMKFAGALVLGASFLIYLWLLLALVSD